MTGKVIHWEDARTGQVITRASEPSEQSLALLEATVWGSRDTRYRIPGLAEKLSRLREPIFFVLSENGIELSVFVLDHCLKQISRMPCGGFHFVMAATLDSRRDEGLATRLVDVIRPYCEKTAGKPGFGFAYVEETTEISLRISEHAGHSIEADIPLMLFTRLMPRDDTSVELVHASEQSKLLACLESLYSDHEFADFAASFRAEECFVYRRDDRITASVQAEILNWSVVSMPGLTGALLLNILPRVPGWNSILNLRDLKVVRFGNIYFADGAETDVFALAEACLARNQSRVGLIMLDRRSPVLARLRAIGNFGLLSGAMKGSIKLHVDTVFMDKALQERLATQPLLVSPADVI